MLLNDLYQFPKITAEATGGGYLVEAEVNPTHEIFKGHFPQTPVLPGVCHMQMVVDAASEILKKRLKVVEGNDMKFTAVVDPREGTHLLIKVNLSELDGGKVKVESATTFNGLVCFKFKGVLH